MTVDHLLEPLLQSMGTGVAVADPDSLEILFENARFLGWLKPNGAESNQLPGRVRGLDVARMRARLEQRRPFLHETEIKEGARTIKLGLEIRQELLGGRALLLVEVRDVSKLKETEYMLDSYTRLAETHARELESEKERVEKLLLNIMPRAVYDEIKDFGAATPQRFPEASILMLDFVDFTQRTGASDPSAIVAELNDIFSAFDRIVAMYDCERIKAVGDAYMAVSGLPEANAGHAVSVARAATRMRRYIQGRNTSHGLRWQCRVGLATGPVIGSIVGVEKYAYDVFGPAVNLAARLEAASEPMQITMGAATAAMIQGEFACRPRGRAEVKGFGELELWTLDDELRNDRRPG